MYLKCIVLHPYQKEGRGEIRTVGDSRLITIAITMHGILPFHFLDHCASRGVYEVTISGYIRHLTW